MKKIEKVTGFVIMDDDNNIIGYEAGNGFNNKIFKDKNEGNNVVYIPDGADWDENGFIPADAGVNCGIYTYNDIVNVVFDFFEKYGFWKMYVKLGEFFSELLLENIECEDPQTYLENISLIQIFNGLYEKGITINIE